MDQSLNPNASVLKLLFFLSDKPTHHVPDPCIPTQSQVEEEHVRRVQVWVVCWVESGVQLVEVRVAQCAE